LTTLEAQLNLLKDRI